VAFRKIRHESVSIIKSVANSWSEDKISLLAASLAYYTMFSIAPLLIISIAVAGFIFGKDASRGNIFQAIQGLVGTQGAAAIQTMVQSASAAKHTGVIAAIIGFITLALGASGVFLQLQDALNSIWHVMQDPKRGWASTIRQRLLSFAMVGAIAFLLLVSLLISAAIAAAGHFVSEKIPGGESIWHLAQFGLTFLITTLLFAMVFKILPDAKIKWKATWLGSAVTSFLFSLGKTIIGLYLGKSAFASAYGAAGSLVIVLVWLYYSAIIFFVGAEFTKFSMSSLGYKIEPKLGAVLLKTQILKDPPVPLEQIQRAS